MSAASSLWPKRKRIHTASEYAIPNYVTHHWARDVAYLGWQCRPLAMSGAGHRLSGWHPEDLPYCDGCGTRIGDSQLRRRSIQTPSRVTLDLLVLGGQGEAIDHDAAYCRHCRAVDAGR